MAFLNEDDIDLMHYVRLFFNKWRLLFVGFFAVVVVVVVMIRAHNAPTYYTASLMYMMPGQSSSGNGGGVQRLFGGGKGNDDLLMQVFKTRRIHLVAAKLLAPEFKSVLQKQFPDVRDYGPSQWGYLIGYLNLHGFQAQKNGAFMVFKHTHADPKIAYTVVRYYADAINQLNEELGLFATKQIFILIDDFGLPTSPSSPTKGNKVKLGAFLGVVLGIVLVIVQDIAKRLYYKK